MTGFYRYVRYCDVAERMDQGWRFAFTLPFPHKEYAIVMKWCCGRGCNDSEIP